MDADDQPDELSKAPVEAIERAIAARDWATVVDVVESSWRALIIEHPGVLTAALRATPLSAMSGRTAVLAVRSWTARPDDESALPEPAPLSAEQIEQVTHTDRAERAVDTAFALTVAYRRRGRYRQALRYADEMVALVRASIETGTAWAPGRLASVLLQSAVVRLHLADNLSAAPFLTEAYENAGRAKWTYVATDSAGKLAALHAMRGEVDVANSWLDREAAAPPAPLGLFRQLVVSLGRVARVLLAVGALDVDIGTGEIEALQDSFLRDEFWAYILHARARFALGWGDRLGLLKELHEARLTRVELTQSSRNGGIAGPLLDAAEANLLMSLGRGNPAHTVAYASAQEHELLDVARARLLLLAGDFDGALHLVESRVEASIGATLDLMLIRAVAQRRQDRSDLARRSFEAAVELAGADRLFAFACVPRDDLVELIRQSPTTQTLLSDDVLAVLPTAFPARVSVVELTRQEQTLLAGFAAGKRVGELAAELYLSPSTLLSHRRNLFRKLQASSPEEALAAAAELGLLRDTSTP
jgi:LuxR family transcriptional regulator, maltose regulon positive regulatory protein